MNNGTFINFILIYFILGLIYSRQKSLDKHSFFEVTDFSSWKTYELALLFPVGLLCQGIEKVGDYLVEKLNYPKLARWWYPDYKSGDLRYLNYDLYQWDLVMKEIIEKVPELEKMSLMDIGGNAGLFFVSLSKHISLNRAMVIDPNWDEVSTNYIDFFELPESFYTEKNILGLGLSGDDGEVPYNEVEFIIKTYCPWVDWKDVLSKTKARYFLSNSSHADGLFEMENIKVHTFKTRHDVFYLVERI